MGGQGIRISMLFVYAVWDEVFVWGLGTISGCLVLQPTDCFRWFSSEKTAVGVVNRWWRGEDTPGPVLPPSSIVQESPVLYLPCHCSIQVLSRDPASAFPGASLTLF